MTDVNRDKTLALAAIFQAAALAEGLARRGYAEPQALKALLASILVFDTDNPEQIYGPVQNLTLGLKTLEVCLGNSDHRGDSRASDNLGYALGLIHIEGQLGKSPALLNLLRQRLEQASAQLPHFDNELLSQGMFTNLAGIYVDTLGTLPFRLQIKGSEQRLQTPGVPEQIRACLLAGVRAAWLWKRLGGRRWHLLFTRSQVVGEIRKLIKEAQENTR